MKKLIAVLAVVVGIAVVAVICLGRDEGRQHASNGGEKGNSHAVSEMPASSSEPSSSVRPSSAKPVLDFGEDDDEDEDEFTPEQRLLADRIEKALDDESLDDAIACAQDALICPVSEIRQAMVDTLGWFGSRALPELTPFLADADEDVRESAMNEWSMAISDIADDALRLETVEMAMCVLNDEDALEDISGEYIGVDERLAVESLMRIIAANGSENGIAKAMETYEFVTGDEWVDAAEAERWIAEEYEPSEEN